MPAEMQLVHDQDRLPAAVVEVELVQRAEIVQMY
jgi:cellobiose-specific phosphotransferase system component IIA